jgi:hypothetical protein
MAAYLQRNVPDLKKIGFCQGDLHAQYYQDVCPPGVDVVGIDLPMQALITPAALTHMLDKSFQFGDLYLKTHHANAQVDDIALIPPGLTNRAVYIVRDPRQVAVSYANHFKCSIDDAITSLGNEKLSIGSKEELSHVVASWSQHVKSWLTATFPRYIMRYEDIGPGPMQGMLTFLGMEPDYERVLQAFEDCELHHFIEQEQAEGFGEAPEGMTFFRALDPWYDVLTDEQADRIINDHGEVMEALKYATGTLHYNEGQERRTCGQL